MRYDPLWRPGVILFLNFSKIKLIIADDIASLNLYRLRQFFDLIPYGDKRYWWHRDVDELKLVTIFGSWTKTLGARLYENWSRIFGVICSTEYFQYIKQYFGSLRLVLRPMLTES